MNCKDASIWIEYEHDGENRNIFQSLLLSINIIANLSEIYGNPRIDSPGYNRKSIPLCNSSSEFK